MKYRFVVFFFLAFVLSLHGMEEGEMSGSEIAHRLPFPFIMQFECGKRIVLKGSVERYPKLARFFDRFETARTACSQDMADNTINFSISRNAFCFFLKNAHRFKEYSVPQRLQMIKAGAYLGFIFLSNKLEDFLNGLLKDDLYKTESAEAYYQHQKELALADKNIQTYFLNSLQRLIPPCLKGSRCTNTKFVGVDTQNLTISCMEQLPSQDTFVFHGFDKHIDWSFKTDNARLYSKESPRHILASHKGWQAIKLPEKPQTLFIHNREKNKVHALLTRDNLSSIALDGHNEIVALANHKHLHLVFMKSKNSVSFTHPTQSSVNCMQFNYDGSILAMGYDTIPFSNLYLLHMDSYNPKTNAIEQSPVEYPGNGSITCFAFHPHKPLLTIGTKYSEINILDLKTKKWCMNFGAGLVDENKNKMGKLTHMLFTDDGTTLGIYSSSGRLVSCSLLSFPAEKISCLSQLPAIAYMLNRQVESKPEENAPEHILADYLSLDPDIHYSVSFINPETYAAMRDCES